MKIRSAISAIMAALLITTACSQAPNKSSKAVQTDSTMKWTKLISGDQCNMENPMNMLITSQAQFDSAWNRAFTMDMPPEKPVIDFTKNSVVALFLGTVNTGGHSIEITGIKANEGNRILITAEHKLPGKNCLSTQAIEFPYYLALINQAAPVKIDFSIIKKELDCQ